MASSVAGRETSRVTAAQGDALNNPRKSPLLHTFHDDIWSRRLRDLAPIERSQWQAVCRDHWLNVAAPKLIEGGVIAVKGTARTS